MADVGWTTEDAADSFLGSLYGSGWSAETSASRLSLLTRAYSELRDHPNYEIPAADDSDWDSLTADEQRRVAEAQQLHALDILEGGAEAADAANMAARGVKSYSIGRFSIALGKQTDNANSREYFVGTPLTQRVKDKLFSFLKDTDIIGRFVRTYEGL